MEEQHPSAEHEEPTPGREPDGHTPPRPTDPAEQGKANPLGDKDLPRTIRQDDEGDELVGSER